MYLQSVTLIKITTKGGAGLLKGLPREWGTINSTAGMQLKEGKREAAYQKYFQAVELSPKEMKEARLFRIIKIRL